MSDVVLTQDELDGLAANLLVSKKPPLSRARISEWLDEYGNRVGQHYASELRRHYSEASQQKGVATRIAFGLTRIDRSAGLRSGDMRSTLIGEMPSHLRRSMGAKRRTALIGISAWLILVGAGAAGWFRFDLVTELFLLAPWLTVPLGSQLLHTGEAPGHGSFILRNPALQQCAAAIATASFLLPAGRAAALLASAWLGVCAAFLLDGLRRLIRWRATSFKQFSFAAGEGYLLVAGLWLVASRLGAHPAGFQEPIVLLTAIHFHFAGFLTAVFAGLTYDQLRTSRWAPIFQALLLAAVVGPGLLGMAFLVGPKLKLIAALPIVIGQCGLPAGMIRIGWPKARRHSWEWLLVVSGASVAIAMILAGAWALGEYPLQAFLDLTQMERIHGTLNAFGFGLLGLFGWLSVAKSSS